MVARIVLRTFAALLSTGIALAHGGHRHGWHDGFDVNVREAPQSCADVEIDAGDRFVATAEQTFTVPRATEPLILRTAEGGGLHVTGWDREDYQVMVCKAATGGRSSNGDEAAARERVAEIDARMDGRRLVTTGPSGDDWIAWILVRAPRQAALELETRNGPLSLRDVDGRLAIRGENGPVSLDGVSGDVTVDLENGPLSLDGGGGNLRLRTENGPISIHLEGRDWNGKGLDARAVNGPLSLDIADGYTGGVVVESSEHAPWSCGGLCRDGSRTWDDGGRRITFGATPARVHLATENGPVAIGRK